MVGHTGVIPAAVAAVETVDRCLGEVVAAVQETRRRAASSPPTTATPTQMLEPDGQPEHGPLAQPRAARSSPSPGLELREGGVLADVAPTVLQLLSGSRSRGSDDRCSLIVASR